MTKTEQASDAEELARISRGDEVAFLTLYRAHGPQVVRLAWGIAPSREAVHEIVQDTFVTLWRKADSIVLIGPSVLPWLLVTCRNHARNRSRKDARWSEVVPLQEDTADTRLEHVAALRWIYEAIEALPDLDREVCHLCLLQGHTYESASAVLGVTPASVGKRLQRAKQRLRRDLS